MKRPLLIAAGIFLIILGLSTPVTTSVALYILPLPETFASSVMILHRTGTPPPLATLVEKISSQAALDPVINDLNLGAMWARKYKQPGSLSPARCSAILKGNIKISQPVRSAVLYIAFYSDDKDEAAVIANKIGAVYCQGTPGAAIMAQAQPNSRPVRPNKPRSILLGLFAGIVLAALGVGLLIAARKPRQ